MIYYLLLHSSAGAASSRPEAKAEHIPRKRINLFICKKSNRNIRKLVKIVHLLDVDLCIIRHIIIFFVYYFFKIGMISSEFKLLSFLKRQIIQKETFFRHCNKAKIWNDQYHKYKIINFGLGDKKSSVDVSTKFTTQ